MVKGWINFAGSGVIAIDDSFNVDSITDEGVGNYTITWDTDFANDIFVAVGSAINRSVFVQFLAAGSTRVETYLGGNLDATSVYVIAIGDQ